MKIAAPDVPHKLIHLDADTHRWLPRRRHDDPDHEGYVGRLQEFFLHQIDKGGLSYIAVIPAADGPQGLSRVFERSNSIDAPWVENEDVQVHPGLKGLRSTSVGDLVVVHDQVLMVDSFGFVNLSRLFEVLQEKVIGPIDERLQRSPSADREFDFTSDRGIPMRAILTLNGESFSNSKQPPHDQEDPIVRIMDMRYGPEAGGQMISSYYLSTFFGCDVKGNGLDMYGGAPDWSLDALQVRAVADWARTALGITAERQLAGNAVMTQIRESLGGDLSKQLLDGEWFTSTRDQLTGYFSYLREGADSQKGVMATAVFAPGSEALVSLEVADRQSNEVLARFEAADLDRQPDFSM